VELRAFMGETDVLRRLKHPHIVEFIGVGALHSETAEAMRRSIFLVQVWLVAAEDGPAGCSRTRCKRPMRGSVAGPAVRPSIRCPMALWRRLHT
jgi:hypothetical protein